MIKLIRELLCWHSWSGIRIDYKERCTWQVCTKCSKEDYPDYWDEREKE